MTDTFTLTLDKCFKSDIWRMLRGIADHAVAQAAEVYVGNEEWEANEPRHAEYRSEATPAMLRVLPLDQELAPLYVEFERAYRAAEDVKGAEKRMADLPGWWMELISKKAVEVRVRRAEEHAEMKRRLALEIAEEGR